MRMKLNTRTVKVHLYTVGSLLGFGGTVWLFCLIPELFFAFLVLLLVLTVYRGLYIMFDEEV